MIDDATPPDSKQDRCDVIGVDAVTRLSGDSHMELSHDGCHDDDIPLKTLAILGTGSDVGKTTIVAGICRLLYRNGVRVAPFKAQNMSNNAAPALLSNGAGWGEIGTAQALQAEACGLVPRVEMNPVLLKSGGRRESDGAYLCSVLVMGKHYATEDYGALGERTDKMRNMVLEAHASLALATNSEIIIVEGAGSCTELNLMERDIVNLPLVRRLECPWLLVADIDKGGVFAQIVGTKACVTEEDWGLCCGIVINRLRGEVKYFEPGPTMIEEMVGKKVFVVPWLYNLHLPEEDGVGIETRLKHETALRGSTSNKPVVVVVAYPHISIASDLTSLEQDDNIVLEWRRNILPPPYPETTAIVLPGSRLTRSDLAWLLEETSWGDFIVDHVKRGGAVMGLCGGYQMLGMHIRDEDGIEGPPGTSVGLGLLPVDTTICSLEQKVVSPRTACLLGQVPVEGFELHCGQTRVAPDTEKLLHFPETLEDDGVRVGKVSGCYLHGILNSCKAREILLHLPCGTSGTTTTLDPLDRLAEHLESCGLTLATVTTLMQGVYDGNVIDVKPTMV